MNLRQGRTLLIHERRSYLWACENRKLARMKTKKKNSPLRNREEKFVKLTLVCRENTVKRAKLVMQKRKSSVSALVDSIMESVIAADSQGRQHPGIEGLRKGIKGKADGIGL